MIIIINHGMGNVNAIQNMLKKIGHRACISNDPAEIKAATKLILPGVGAFDECARNMVATGLVPLLSQRVLEDKVPVLGICVGMQLLGRGSEEGLGQERGLSWIQADTRRFDASRMPGLKVPHMGWNFVTSTQTCAMTNDLPDDARFYFVHSYHPICDDPADVMLTAHYGYDFAAGVHRGNVYGVQFHPEKSHKFGMQLLTNFVERVT